MSKAAGLAVLERAAENDSFLAQLADDSAKACTDYDLTSEEAAALSSGDVCWVEAHIGKLDKRLRTWLDCRLQQEKW
jgi:hypothetical protein